MGVDSVRAGRIRSRLTTVSIAVVVALVLLGLTGCGAPEESGPPRAALQTPPDRPLPEAFPGPPFNFDKPISGIVVSSSTEAQSRAAFPIVQPSNLGSAVSILVSDHAKATSVAFVYDHPEFGRVAVVESRWEFDRSKFDAMIDELLASNDSPGSLGHAEQVVVRGQRAMLNTTAWGHLLLDFLEGSIEVGVHGRDATKEEMLQIGDGL
jgi:hypothetical protein